MRVQNSPLTCLFSFYLKHACMFLVDYLIIRRPNKAGNFYNNMKPVNRPYKPVNRPQ